MPAERPPKGLDSPLLRALFRLRQEAARATAPRSGAAAPVLVAVFAALDALCTMVRAWDAPGAVAIAKSVAQLEHAATTGRPLVLQELAPRMNAGTVLPIAVDELGMRTRAALLADTEIECWRDTVGQIRRYTQSVWSDVESAPGGYQERALVWTEATAEAARRDLFMIFEHLHLLDEQMRSVFSVARQQRTLCAPLPDTSATGGDDVGGEGESGAAARARKAAS